MKDCYKHIQYPLKGIKLLVSISLLMISPTIINAKDFELASISNNSETFDLPIIIDGTTSFSSMIFNDVNKNGKREEGEDGIAGVTVKLIDKDGNEINVGPDGILGNEDDSLGGVLTNLEGRYSFSKITHKFYRIQIEVE